MTKEPGSEKTPFIAYPFGYLFGVVESQSEGDALERDLAEAGLATDELMRFTGEDGAERIDASGKGHGVFAQAIRTLQYSDDSRLHAEMYAREARAGRCVIGVRAPTNEEKLRAHAVFERHGVRFVVYYGPTGLTESISAPG